jgi:N-acetyl-beta-hexosaminidase
MRELKVKEKDQSGSSYADTILQQVLTSHRYLYSSRSLPATGA